MFLNFPLGSEVDLMAMNNRVVRPRYWQASKFNHIQDHPPDSPVQGVRDLYETDSAFIYNQCMEYLEQHDG